MAYGLQNVLLFFKISVMRSIKNQGYAILQFTELTRLVDTVYEAFGCDCLRSGTDDAVEHSLKPDTGISEQRGLGMRENFRLELLETLKSFLNVLRATHAIVSLSERIL